MPKNLKSKMSPSLRRKVEIVMQREGLRSFKAALLFLAQKVVSPN